MPVETFQRPVRTPVRMPVAAAPPRLRPKGPVAPDFSRQSPSVVAAMEARPRQSAVARLEADKAKYVKSQVALSKQQPVRPPDVSVRHRPLTTSPAGANANLRPTRKTPTQTKPDGAQQLDLQHLSNLISGVGDAGPQNTTQQKKERPSPASRPAPRPDWSSPAKVRLKASVPPPPPPAAVENTGVSGSQAAAAAGTVRRVDVMPQAGPARSPCRRPQLLLRPPLQPLPLPPHPLFPLRPAPSHLRLLHLRTPPASSSPSPLKPAAVGPVKPDNNPTPPPPLPLPLPLPPPPPAAVFPPPSPAFTRLSSGGSRKRPSLTRSKSDMSDRFSRAGTELERFFNLCGLDPADLQEFTGSSSDIVSLARFRSVSAPGSEVAAGEEEEEEEEEKEEELGGVPNAAEARVPYGVSVIERNARVIKWLYGLRQARDINAARSTNL